MNTLGRIGLLSLSQVSQGALTTVTIRPPKGYEWEFEFLWGWHNDNAASRAMYYQYYDVQTPKSVTGITSVTFSPVVNVAMSEIFCPFDNASSSATKQPRSQGLIVRWHQYLDLNISDMTGAKTIYVIGRFVERPANLGLRALYQFLPDVPLKQVISGYLGVTP